MEMRHVALVAAIHQIEDVRPQRIHGAYFGQVEFVFRPFGAQPMYLVRNYAVFLAQVVSQRRRQLVDAIKYTAVRQARLYPKALRGTLTIRLPPKH